MKEKLNFREEGDIGGTNIIPISSLAYLMGVFNLSSLANNFLPTQLVWILSK
jgi:hypothetical protein